MFCKHCGKENPPKSSFCGSCGQKLNDESKNLEIINKFKELPKKSKIIMGIVLLIVIIAFIVLVILLNNSVKKVEDNLANYYDFYNENRTKELLEIGRIIRSNKDNPKVLNSIKDTTHNITSKWVKNFNTSYKDKETLEKAYKKVASAISNLYNYYDGLDYILDYELYTTYMNELDDLYSSKKNYFNGEENKNKENDYYAYYYYQKVIEKDSYYKLAKNYITEYIEDEMTDFKDKLNNIINAGNASNNEEKLKIYYEALDYLQENKVTNNIDLSNTEEYQNLYSDIVNKIVEATKLLVSELASTFDYNKCLEIINNALDKIDNDELKEYEELLTLKENYEDKKPISLLERNLVSKTQNLSESRYTRVINNVEYDSYISFKTRNTTESIVYNLNKEYKTFKARITNDKELNDTNIGITITIYGDNKELYHLSLDENTKDIEIDVSNVDNLKIEVLTSNVDDYNIYLVEPYLYK